jgi:hypothetical protein
MPDWLTHPIRYLTDHPAAGSLAQWVGAIITSLAVIVALFKESIINRLSGPILKLTFEHTGHHISKTVRNDSTPTYYCRVAAVNVRARIAKLCRAYLINIEQLRYGQWQPTTYCESLPLGWVGYRDRKFDAVDIPRGVQFYIDVLSTHADRKTFQLEIELTLNRYREFLSAPGRYRFTILIVGDHAKSDELSLEFEWTGQWDAFRVNGELPPDNEIGRTGTASS